MSDLQSIIAAGWVILFGALIGEVISMPLLGALVRWRVHYDPDRVRLGDSERPKTEPGPLVTGYFSTVRRVYRLEGWAGLYKGFWPSVFNTLVPLLVALPFLDGDMNLAIGRQARFGDYGVVGPVLQVTLFQVSLSRFAVQKTQSAEEDDNSVETAADIAAAARVESYLEDVIALRDDHPYVSFADYVNRAYIKDPERLTTKSTRLLVDGYASTLRRLVGPKGWAGLYKGFWPSFVGVFAASLIALSLPPDDPDLMVGRPASAIVTPYKLRSSNPLVAYKLLLSPIERRHPWKIYLLPGVFVSQFANTLLITVFAPTITSWLEQLAEKRMAVAVILHLAVVFPGSCLYTLFQVALARLPVQRTWSSEENNTGVETVADIAAGARVQSYSHEDVIVLRDDQDPYVSFTDYVNKVTTEEGWRVLLRAWWASFLLFYGLASFRIVQWLNKYM
ncbi:hypothetical protein AAF712_008849 [Marasmius tenuissimus]|uniref:Mitochondrial carrier n=1 Tax=Marasmius tenuissimus TaxID=585030 RepID=A0ABR2ZSX8_9AGAR